MAGWSDPPSVIAVSGAVDLFRIREIRKGIKAAQRKKRRVERLDGEDSVDVERVLAGTVFFDERVLAIITKPDKLDPALVIRHHESRDTSAVFLLHYEGHLKNNSKFHKLLNENEIKHLAFPSPKPWEAEDKAVAFCIREAKRQKKVLAERKARSLVRICGTEYGFLSWEIFKLCTYLDSIGETEAESEHLRGLISTMSAASVFPVSDALGAADARALLKEMNRVRRTHPDDPTMRVCGVLSASVGRWLHAISAKQSGLSIEYAARAVGATPTRMRKTLLPAAERWGEHRLIKLLGILTGVERAVKSGRSNPWVLLQSRLVAACRDRQANG